MLCCDLLAWILITKLAPTYYQKLDRLLKDTGRYCKLSSWHKCFKKTWWKLEKTPITLPLNDAYRPNVEKWICTCPAFIVSRFLLCKHLVQNVQQVPPVFFLKVKQCRTTPFWQHKSLKPLEGNCTETTEGVLVAEKKINEDNDSESEANKENKEEEEEEETYKYDGHTFEQVMESNIDLITEFTKGLRYQVQFQDQWMLMALQHKGASFLWLARACIEKEKAMNLMSGGMVSTWDKSMFYHTRPTHVDQGT